MITFKQKMYFAPLAALGGKAALGLMTAGGVGISAVQGAKANAEAKEQTEELERHNRKMEKLAKEQGAQNIEEMQKSFGAIPVSVLRGMDKVKNSNVGGLAKDMWSIHGSGLKKAAGMGAGFAALGYAGNRAAQSWKDHDEGNDGENKKFLAKAATGAALVGGGILAARSGKLGTTVQNFMTTGKGASAMKAAGKAINPIVKDQSGNIKKGATLRKVAMNGGIAAIPVLGYAAQRGQEKEQSEAQANYSDNGENKSGLGKKLLTGAAVLGSVAGAAYGAKRGVFGARAQKAVGNAMATSGSYLRNYKSTAKVGDKLIKSGSDAYGTGMAKQISKEQAKAGFKNWEVGGDFYNSLRDRHVAKRAAEATSKPASLLTGTANAVSKPLNWFGMAGTKGGVEAMKNTAQKMVDPKNSELTRKAGEWILKSDKNAAKATIAGGVGALAAGTTAMAVGDKAVKAVTKTVDKGAYKMEEEQNQKVYSEETVVKKGIKFYPKTGKKTKFLRKSTEIHEPGFHEISQEVLEKSFTKWDETDQLKGMKDSDILAEQKRPTSSLSLGKSIAGAGAGMVAGRVIGKKLGSTGTGALAGAAIGGMAGMDKQTREKTAIGAGIGAAAGLGLKVLTKGRFGGLKTGAMLGGTLGVASGVASGHKQNKENEFFNDRLEYAQRKAMKREKADWKNNMNNREGYTY